jgi:hypothetical protein
MTIISESKTGNYTHLIHEKKGAIYIPIICSTNHSPQAMNRSQNSTSRMQEITKIIFTIFFTEVAIE